MPHQHYFIDFVVSVFVVHQGKVLLVHHKELGKWLPLGGHIEPDEDPEQAAFREVKEESGLEIELLGARPQAKFRDAKSLHAPAYLDIHRIQGAHRHVGMVYFARARSASVRLAAREHSEIRWFSAAELKMSRLEIPSSVRFYGQEAIRRLTPLRKTRSLKIQ